MKQTAVPEEAELIIQKLPGDMGIHRNPRKGTLDAPEELLNQISLESLVIVDEVFPDEFDLGETQSRIRENSSRLAKYEKPLLSVGGDHSVSYPVISALKEQYPDLRLVWLDAHLDLKNKIDENISHDVVVRQLLEDGFEQKDIWLVGITEIDHDEEEFLKNHENLRVFKHDELEEFQREFKKNEQPVYLSADIDVLNVEGTGYPDGKLELDQALQIIQEVQPTFADLVEVAPPFDKDGETVEKGVKILEELETVLKTEGKTST